MPRPAARAGLGSRPDGADPSSRVVPSEAASPFNAAALVRKLEGGSRRARGGTEGYDDANTLVVEKLTEWGEALSLAHEIPPKQPAARPSGGNAPTNAAEDTLRELLHRAGFPEAQWQKRIDLGRPLGGTVVLKPGNKGKDELGRRALTPLEVEDDFEGRVRVIAELLEVLPSGA